MRRAGIFAFFDDDGYVDKYVEYLLDDIIQNLDRLMVVCNGVLSDDGQRVLKNYTQEIVIRPDTGFDVAGFKCGIDYLGWNELEKYDEIVLFNDSFFGPLYPFREVFDKMDRQPAVDFWGLSVHGATPAIPDAPNRYDYRPRYLQTFFVVFRKRLVCSEVFQAFWANMPEYKTFHEVAANFGPVITKGFEDAGFRMGIYSDTTDLESDDIKKNISNHTYNMYEMVANRHFPILKRRAFITRKDVILRYNYGNDLKKTMDFVEQHTKYDTSLIYRYLLRKYNLDDIKKSLNLLTIIPDVDIYGGKKYYQGRSIAVFLHTSYPDLFDYDLCFLQNLPPEIDIYVTNSDKYQLDSLQKKFSKVLKNHLTYIKVEQRGRNISALLVGCHDYILQYDYICFIFDKKAPQKENTAVGSSFRDLIWENTLFSSDYVSNIINRFETHPCLGLMVSPNVYHGSYFNDFRDTWASCYEKTAELAYSLGITVPFDRGKEAFSSGSSFWARTVALKPILLHDWTYSDFPPEPISKYGTLIHALERLFPYAAQHSGYYTEYMLNLQYASSELINFRTMYFETLNSISGMPLVNYNTYELLIRTLKKSVAEFRMLWSGSKKSPSARYQQYQISYSFLQYADKKLPSWLSRMLRRILKIPNGVPVFKDLGVKGALVMWADERAPRLIGKLIHRAVKM